MKLGNLLRKLRKDQVLTQKELASRAGVSQSVVSNAENDEREPTLDSLLKICQVFHLTLSGFFALLENNSSASNSSLEVGEFEALNAHVSDNETVLICKYRQLSLRDQATVSGLIEVLLKQEKRKPSSVLPNGDEKISSNPA